MTSPETRTWTFQTITSLGKGEYGCVCLVEDVATHQRYAMKIWRLRQPQLEVSVIQALDVARRISLQPFETKCPYLPDCHMAFQDVEDHECIFLFMDPFLLTLNDVRNAIRNGGHCRWLPPTETDGERQGTKEDDEDAREPVMTSSMQFTFTVSHSNLDWSGGTFGFHRAEIVMDQVDRAVDEAWSQSVLDMPRQLQAWVDYEIVVTHKGKKTEEFAFTLACQIATAIAALHQRLPGYIHADLKPGNVLFHLDTGTIRLIDFDLVHRSHRSFHVHQHPTQDYCGNEFWDAVPVSVHSIDTISLGLMTTGLILGAAPLRASAMPPGLSDATPEATAQFAESLNHKAAIETRARLATWCNPDASGAVNFELYQFMDTTTAADSDDDDDDDDNDDGSKQDGDASLQPEQGKSGWSRLAILQDPEERRSMKDMMRYRGLDQNLQQQVPPYMKSASKPMQSQWASWLHPNPRERPSLLSHAPSRDKFHWDKTYLDSLVATLNGFHATVCQKRAHVARIDASSIDNTVMAVQKQWFNDEDGSWRRELVRHALLQGLPGCTQASRGDEENDEVCTLAIEWMDRLLSVPTDHHLTDLFTVHPAVSVRAVCRGWMDAATHPAARVMAVLVSLARNLINRHDATSTLTTSKTLSDPDMRRLSQGVMVSLNCAGGMDVGNTRELLTRMGEMQFYEEVLLAARLIHTRRNGTDNSHPATHPTTRLALLLLQCLYMRGLEIWFQIKDVVVAVASVLHLARMLSGCASTTGPIDATPTWSFALLERFPLLVNTEKMSNFYDALFEEVEEQAEQLQECLSLEDMEWVQQEYGTSLVTLIALRKQLSHDQH